MGGERSVGSPLPGPALPAELDLASPGPALPPGCLAGSQRPEEEVWLPGRVGLPDAVEPHCDPAIPETLPTLALSVHIRPGGVSARLSGGRGMPPRSGCSISPKWERTNIFFFLAHRGVRGFVKGSV